MLDTLIPKTSLLCLLLFIINLSATAQSSQKFDTGVDVLHSDDKTSLRFRIAYTSQITPKLSAGPGAGYTHYDDPLSLLPLFLHVKYTLREGDTVPFLFLRSGYSFSILTDTDITVDEHEGGWLLNPGVGIQIATASEAAFYFSAGYNVNHAKFKNKVTDNRTIETDITYKRLMVGVGLLF